MVWEGMMDSILKEQWIAALRSGEYRQWQGQLRSPISDGYCCLGVLCELLPEMVPVKNGYLWQQYEYGDAYVETSLPAELARDIGLESDIQDNLIRMNDALGMSFNDIATYLEGKGF